MYHDATPRWIVMFAAVFVIGILVRLANGHRTGVLLFLALGIGLMFVTYGVRQGAPPMKSIVVATEAAPPRPISVAKPSRAKRPTKGTPPAAPAAPEVPQAPRAERPSAEPPVAESPAITVVQDAVSVPATAESEVPEAPITLYQGSSKVGRPVDKLPDWVTEHAKAGSTSIAVSSERFASIGDAEAELWKKAKEIVVSDLHRRIPDAVYVFWSPSTELLRQRGLVVERCIERTTIEVGKFVEPMYRVHWKLSLSNDLRTSVVDAWRPTVQAGRLKGVTLGFLGATGAFAFLNIILRSIAARLAARKTTTTTQVA